MAPPADAQAPPPGVVAAEELAELRAKVRARIEVANKTTEDEVLALGESIHVIVSQARGYAAEVRTELAGLEGDTGISAALAGQSSCVERLSEHVGGGLQALTSRAGAAEALCRDILEIGGRIYEISIATKVLSVNARLEAARSTDGGSFGVIAHEMSSLNQLVQASNDEINGIARKLLVVLPEIQRMATALRAEADRYRAQIELHGAEVADGEAALRAALVRCLALGEDRVARIVAESRAAASHLVFQDPVAQSLMRIDADMHALEARARGEVSAAPMQVELGQALDGAAVVSEDEDFIFL